MAAIRRSSLPGALAKSLVWLMFRFRLAKPVCHGVERNKPQTSRSLLILRDFLMAAA